MTFSTLIIGVAFLPLFTMTGVSGVIFAPMARTYAFAIGGAICPRADADAGPRRRSSSRRRARRRRASSCARLHRLYNPSSTASLRSTRSAAPLALVPILASVLPLPARSGGEFMPKLEEGNFWIRATLPMSISLEQSAKYVGRMRSILRGCPADPNVAVRRGAPQAPRGRDGRLAARAPRRRDRRRRASTTSSSSRRSSRSTSGRAA